MGGREGGEETRTRREGVDKRKRDWGSGVGTGVMGTERVSLPLGWGVLLPPVTLASDRLEGDLGSAAITQSAV